MNKLYRIIGNPLHEELSVFLKFYGIPFSPVNVSPFKSGMFKIYGHKSLPVVASKENQKQILNSDIKKIIQTYVKQTQNRDLSTNEISWINYINKNVEPSVTLYLGKNTNFPRMLYSYVNNINNPIGFLDRYIYRYCIPLWFFLKFQFNGRKALTLSYATSSDYPISVIGAEIADRLYSKNIEDEVYLAGSKPGLIDICLYGALRPLQLIDQVGVLSNIKTINWFNNMNTLYTLKCIE
ncbi:hypothetical protein WA158_002682 [Blastocystis sp. Blastoise]